MRQSAFNERCDWLGGFVQLARASVIDFGAAERRIDCSLDTLLTIWRDYNEPGFFKTGQHPVNLLLEMLGGQVVAIVA